MMDGLDWLPSLILFRDYGGDWNVYVEVLYGHFKQDFIESRLFCDGRRVSLKRYPLEQGKEATFWHMISDGNVEDDRLPDLRRCERIRWPRPIIEHGGDDRVKVWKNKRKGEIRICLWLESQNYLLIMADRKNYVLPWTAYLVEYPHRRRKLQQEYEDYWRAPF